MNDTVLLISISNKTDDETQFSVKAKLEGTDLDCLLALLKASKILHEMAENYFNNIKGEKE